MTAQNGHDRFDAQGRITQHEIRSGPVDRFEISFMGNATDDAQIAIQPTAIYGQVDVHGILIGREQGGSRLENPSALEQLAIGGVPREYCVDFIGERHERALRTVDGMHTHPS